MEDFTGKTFGEWTLLCKTDDPRPGTYYECQCSCGKIQNVHLVSMKRGRSKRCFTCARSKVSTKDEMINKKFGKWLVLYVADVKYKSYQYMCRCDCGTEKVLHGPNLRYGHTTQCTTCGNREKAKNNKTHGLANSSTYKSWNQMHQRCKNPKATNYHRYGGRGIKVCERWNKFDNFLKDMGERPDKLTLDRIDNNCNYEPSNCRWISHQENCMNTVKQERKKK